MISVFHIYVSCFAAIIWGQLCEVFDIILVNCGVHTTTENELFTNLPLHTVDYRPMLCCPTTWRSSRDRRFGDVIHLCNISRFNCF